jgi:hypothetical protein
LLAHSSIMRLRGRQDVVSTGMLRLARRRGVVVSTCMQGLEVDPVVGPPLLRPGVRARWLHIRMK